MSPLIRICTVSSKGTRPPSAMIFLIFSPSLEPFRKCHTVSARYLVFLSPHEVADRDVRVAEFLHEFRALGALARGGASYRG